MAGCACPRSAASWWQGVVTKRIQPLIVDGKPIHVVGMPIHWGFTGRRAKGYGANTLTPYVGDANIETPEYKAFLVDIEASTACGLREEPMTNLQSQDFIRISASTLTPPSARNHEVGSGQAHRRVEVHRLQGVPGRLPGVERSQDRGRIFRGVLRQSARSDADTWTLMRFTE